MTEVSDDNKIIDGKGFAAGLRGRIATAVSRLKSEHDLTPGLAVVLVGEDPASQVYVRNKGKQTVEAGTDRSDERVPLTMASWLGPS